MAHPHGFEPRLDESESSVLPLNDGCMACPARFERAPDGLEVRGPIRWATSTIIHWLRQSDKIS